MFPDELFTCRQLDEEEMVSALWRGRGYLSNSWRADVASFDPRPPMPVRYVMCGTRL